MKMSSPKLNILISIGGIILNVACLMYGMDYFFAEKYDEATVTCQVILLLSNLEFHIENSTKIIFLIKCIHVTNMICFKAVFKKTS